MEPVFSAAIPVLPAADVALSLGWWTHICGFDEAFRHGEPVGYAGISRGAVRMHLSLMADAALARTIGEQTMVRVAVKGVEAYYAEYQRRGGTVHPNGPLQRKPWGSYEFAAIDPNGVCVTFAE